MCPIREGRCDRGRGGERMAIHWNQFHKKSKVNSVSLSLVHSLNADGDLISRDFSFDSMTETMQSQHERLHYF